MNDPAAELRRVVPIRDKQQEELLHLRRIARAAGAMMISPGVPEHKALLLELLRSWRLDMGGM